MLSYKFVADSFLKIWLLHGNVLVPKKAIYFVWKTEESLACWQQNDEAAKQLRTQNMPRCFSTAISRTGITTMNENNSVVIVAVENDDNEYKYIMEISL